MEPRLNVILRVESIFAIKMKIDNVAWIRTNHHVTDADVSQFGEARMWKENTGCKKSIVLFGPKHFKKKFEDYFVAYDGAADNKGSLSNWVDVEVYGFGGHRTIVPMTPEYPKLMLTTMQKFRTSFQRMRWMARLDSMQGYFKKLTEASVRLPSVSSYIGGIMWVL